MKLARITTLYPGNLKDFYSRHQGISKQSYQEQKKNLEYNAFGWSDFWDDALIPLGYDVMEIILNAEPMQRAWARENSIPDSGGMGLNEIALEQIKWFQPDILWFDDLSEDLLKRIRFEFPSIRLVLGWVGSAIPKSSIWQHMDLILTCAPESRDYLQAAGFRSKQIHHGFDPRINSRLNDNPKKSDVSFIGQIVLRSQFHLYREHFLEQLTSHVDIDIFSPNADFGWKDDFKTLLMQILYEGYQITKHVGFLESTIKSLPVIGKVTQWTSKPRFPINRKLQQSMKPAVFGLEMFQVLRDSKISLNIHADSSPTYASNIRLFEATGVGTCLLTDWKENIPELFEPDKEVVIYKTVPECVEKIRWLLEHPKEREEIAQAGKARTLKEHTFSHRAKQLDEIIRIELGYGNND
jgi:spore maturation protein CgeB